MKKLGMTFIAIICLLLTACENKDVPGTPMKWSYEILTPESVVWLGHSLGNNPNYYFKANGKEGDMIMTCENFDVLNPFARNSYTYDCGWATLKIEGNQVKIHFPPRVSNAQPAYEEILVTAKDGKKKTSTKICLKRIFTEAELPVK